MFNPYGMKNEKLYIASEVERGLACECVCPACGHKLIACKGEKTIDYFKHDRDSECDFAYETALHLLAKDILKEERKILIPELIVESDIFIESYKTCSKKKLWLNQGKSYELIMLD